ncbi:MAG: ABC transporter permease [Deltaproteobacteria bacterium]|nr:ABC transporter permease [Deltaproteobacteria bacterium]
MDLIARGIARALALIFSLDAEVLRITLLSLQISGTATLVSVLLGISAGTALALNRFPGRRILVGLVNTSMGLPPVVVGLFVALMLWRSGPLGALDIIYTPAAMIAAQAILAFPIVTGITLAAIQQIPPGFRLQVLSLGATRLQMVWVLVKEARLPLMAAVMAGFGGAISEIGASIMVGGNIKGHTRVLTTAVVMETSRGNFDMAIALGIILFILAFSITLLLTFAQQRERRR